MSFTTEQPSSLDFESCCICMDEFSNDVDLAAHLLKHAEENAYSDSNNNNNNQRQNGPTSFGNVSFSNSNFSKSPANNQNPVNSRPISPEVLEINSDDDDDNFTSTPVSQPPPLQNHVAPQPRRNILPVNKQPQQQVRPVARSNIAQPKSNQMQPPFNCNVCSSVFNNPREFRDHLLTHEKPRPYSCHICKKNFAYKGTLRQHLKMHVGDRLYQCPTCNKRFTIKSVLKKHCEDAHGIFSP